MSKFVEKLVHEPARMGINSSWNNDFKTEEYANFAQANISMKTMTPKTQDMTENTTCENWVLKKTGGYAQAYVPFQETLNLVSGNKGIVCGSIFADLIIPYTKPAPNASLSVS